MEVLTMNSATSTQPANIAGRANEWEKTTKVNKNGEGGDK
jgi:hypothetical protein